MAQQAASPASPAPATHGQHADHPWASSALHDASNLLQNEPPGTASKAVRAPLALTHACATPEGSVLRTNARRVAHASAVKDFVAQQGTALQGALTHFRCGCATLLWPDRPHAFWPLERAAALLLQLRGKAGPGDRQHGRARVSTAHTPPTHAPPPHQRTRPRRAPAHALRARAQLVREGRRARVRERRAALQGPRPDAAAQRRRRAAPRGRVRPRRRSHRQQRCQRHPPCAPRRPRARLSSASRRRPGGRGGPGPRRRAGGGAQPHRAAVPPGHPAAGAPSGKKWWW